MAAACPAIDPRLSGHLSQAPLLPSYMTNMLKSWTRLKLGAKRCSCARVVLLKAQTRSTQRANFALPRP